LPWLHLFLGRAEVSRAALRTVCVRASGTGDRIRDAVVSDVTPRGEVSCNIAACRRSGIVEARGRRGTIRANPEMNAVRDLNRRAISTSI
jgi:hypothetical protein